MIIITKFWFLKFLIISMFTLSDFVAVYPICIYLFTTTWAETLIKWIIALIYKKFAIEIRLIILFYFL